MSSQIRAYKQGLADILLADPNFATVPVLVKIPKEILSQLNTGLAPLQGITAIIGGFSARNLKPVQVGPYFDSTSVLIDIIENVTIDEAANPGLDCDDLGEIAAALIHQNPSLGVVDQLPEVVDWMEVEDKDYSVRRIVVKAPFGLLYQPPTIAPVVPSSTVAGLVSLSCATPGAAIFYTLDKTYPAPTNIASLNGTGFLYTGAIDIAPGQLLTARAWLAGYGAPPPPNPPELSQQY